MRFALILAAVLAAAQEVPRPEAPDPQFERPLWQTLNGRWEFEFDDADADLAENWAAAPRKFSRSILVPFCFESRKSGIGDTSFHPVVWYRRTAVMPDAWKGKRGLLKSGAVDYHAAVWVNGGFAGERFGGHTPFGFDITAHLKAGPNSLVVRAYDSPTDRSQPRSEQYWEPKSRSIFYTRTTGIWQSGWLEAAGAPYLERFRLTPEMDGSLPAEVRITRFTDGLALETEVSLEGKVVARSWTAAAARVFRAGVQVPSPQPWTLNNPRLYDVTFTLKKGEETLDRVRSYTGFRKAAVENGRFTFNGARKHQKVEDPRFLYRADKMGLLVSGEAANSYQSWGGPNPGDPRQQAHLRGLYQLTKSLDPTRPVIDNEGWQHTGTTNLFAVQDYGKDFETLNSRRQRFVKTGKLPPHGTPYLAPGQAYNGTPLYLSEFGGIACIPEGANVPQGSWGNSGVEKPVQAALDRLHGQYQAIAAKPFMGICYTQLTDVEQEVNGLLTYDRKPKIPSEGLRKINGLLL